MEPAGMSEARISLGINVSILVILTIFGVLLSLPLRLLIDTNYYTQSRLSGENETTKGMDNTTKEEVVVIPIDHKKLQRCPKLDYEPRLISVFQSDYDRNCTYVEVYLKSAREGRISKEKEWVSGDEDDTGRSRVDSNENLTENEDDSAKSRRSKSIPVAVHILVTMLVILALAAFVETLRIYFAKLKDSTRTDNANTRNGSIVDNPALRRFLPRQSVISQRSFEIHGVHRSAMRLLGARPPPLIRRSSFPTQPFKTGIGSMGNTPNRSNRMSRRQSIEGDADIHTSHHHLIRRH